MANKSEIRTNTREMTKKQKKTRFNLCFLFVLYYVFNVCVYIHHAPVVDAPADFQRLSPQIRNCHLGKNSSRGYGVDKFSEFL